MDRKVHHPYEPEATHLTFEGVLEDLKRKFLQPLKQRKKFMHGEFMCKNILLDGQWKKILANKISSSLPLKSKMVRP